MVPISVTLSFLHYVSGLYCYLLSHPVTGENCLEVHTMNVFDELDGNEFIKSMLENSTTVEPSSVTVIIMFQFQLDKI